MFLLCYQVTYLRIYAAFNVHFQQNEFVVVSNFISLIARVTKRPDKYV